MGASGAGFAVLPILYSSNGGLENCLSQLWCFNQRSACAILCHVLGRATHIKINTIKTKLTNSHCCFSKKFWSSSINLSYNGSLSFIIKKIIQHSFSSPAKSLHRSKLGVNYIWLTIFFLNKTIRIISHSIHGRQTNYRLS